MSRGQILHTGNERARVRQREIFHLVNASSSTFRSHCLHFRPRHYPLPSFFFLILIRVSTLLKTKLSPVLWQLSLFCHKALRCHWGSHKEQLVVPLEERILAFEKKKIGILRSSKAELHIEMEVMFFPGPLDKVIQECSFKS